MESSKTILESWQANANAWIKTIEGQEIESRNLVTNQAIIDTILSYDFENMVDIGCGEGWLCRTLRNKGINCFGIDAVSSLVEHAISKDGPYYTVGSYKEIAEGNIIQPDQFDAAVINFALIDKEETEALVNKLPYILKHKGYLFVQTLHPFSVAEGGDYESGWRDGSWSGMKQDFILPYKWYFRTVGDWIQLFITSSFSIQEIREPVHPVTRKPASIIFVLQNSFSI